MRIAWYAKARQDLDRAVDFIADQNPQAATAVEFRLLGAVDHLSQFPNAGRRGRAFATREIVIPEYPYVIRYRVKDDEVQILRVFHTSRRWSD